MTEEQMHETCDKIEVILQQSKLSVLDCIDVLKILIVSQIVTQAAAKGISYSVARMSVQMIGDEMVSSVEKSYALAIQSSDSHPNH